MNTWAGVAFVICSVDPTGGGGCDIVQSHVKNTIYYETEAQCKWMGLMHGSQHIIPQYFSKGTPVRKIDPICINAANYRLPGDLEIGTGIDEPEDDAMVVPTPGSRNEIQDCKDALYNCQENHSDVLEKMVALGEKGCGDADEDPDAPHDPTNDGTASNAIRPDDILAPSQEAF